MCSSVNNVVVHGIPDERPLQDGDIVNYDVAAYLGGAFGDNSCMVELGTVDEEGRRLFGRCLRGQLVHGGARHRGRRRQAPFWEVPSGTTRAWWSSAPWTKT